MSIVQELHTARLRLRRARSADADAMHAVLSDPRAMRHWSSAPHADIAQTRAWIGDMVNAPPEESDDFVVERDGTVIGKAGFWRLPEIGFILHPDHWNQGLAREALAALIVHGFTVHPIAAITADVDPDNERSLRLLRGLGFGETGRAARTFQINGAWFDSVYLALSRPVAPVR